VAYIKSCSQNTNSGTVPACPGVAGTLGKPPEKKTVTACVCMYHPLHMWYCMHRREWYSRLQGLFWPGSNGLYHFHTGQPTGKLVRHRFETKRLHCKRLVFKRLSQTRCLGPVWPRIAFVLFLAFLMSHATEQALRSCFYLCIITSAWVPFGQKHLCGYLQTPIATCNQTDP